MSNDVEVILKLWPLFLGVLMLTAWLIRLEANHKSLKEKFDDFKESVKENSGKLWSNIDTIKSQNTEILQSISRLEGKFENQKGVSHEKTV